MVTLGLRTEGEKWNPTHVSLSLDIRHEINKEKHWNEIGDYPAY